ncbi:MAG: kynurenine formamidase [Planctomycetaceae bacterium]|jgi:kynurenine formamidase
MAKFIFHSVLALSMVSAVTNSGLAQEPKAMTSQDVEHLVKELSNWGRWGKDDQLGTLNLITPGKRQEAAKLVKRGVSVSLARNAETTEAADNPKPFGHTMLAFGKGSTGQWAMDNYSVSYHGLAHTHMDSLCHLFHNGKMYNGFSRDEVQESGTKKLGIQNIKGGIFTRGILIDIPRLRGVRFLEPGSAILPSELTAWEERAGIKVRSGDVIFIRTGRWARRDLVGPWDAGKDGLAGLHASCAPWLKSRDIAMLGSDAAADVIPSGIPGVSHPIHVLTLHAMGIHIFDNCDLEEISRVAAEFEQWEFLLTASPLAVQGGTGSPLNPIATY